MVVVGICLEGLRKSRKTQSQLSVYQVRMQTYIRNYKTLALSLEPAPCVQTFRHQIIYNTDVMSVWFALEMELILWSSERFKSSVIPYFRTVGLIILPVQDFLNSDVCPHKKCHHKHTQPVGAATSRQYKYLPCTQSRRPVTRDIHV